ncbi:helix-turn-helix domain-containing protein [Cellulomonas composti]|uniref:DNA-binding protein n=1 Tax=Cellulomonas composti TaxID=266130 RepID=A0A511J6E6_9CELL|nr:XRE family transcriptional regulator [Cellulomonas composti]GEL93582.1 DNA-binding protein [Cellulomonas composti]
MPDGLDQVGARLRVARRANGWTLDELARRAGMSPSTLSRLEQGKRQATLELLIPLTRELRLRIDDLVRPPVQDPRVRRPVVRRDGLEIVPLTPEGAPIQTFKATHAPVDVPPSLKTHDGYEWLYVLAGRLRLRLGDQDLVLTRGEAADFDTRIPHAMSAAGSRPAQILSIFNEAGVEQHTHVRT